MVLRLVTTVLLLLLLLLEMLEAVNNCIPIFSRLAHISLLTRKGRHIEEAACAHCLAKLLGRPVIAPHGPYAIIVRVSAPKPLSQRTRLRRVEDASAILRGEAPRYRWDVHGRYVALSAQIMGASSQGLSSVRFYCLLLLLLKQLIVENAYK
jgi:hypothetical protein